MLICMGYLEFNQEFRRRLIALRQEHGLTQPELSEELLGNHHKGLQSRLSRLENGKASPTLLDVFLLAKRFGEGFVHGIGFPFEAVCEFYKGRGNVTVPGATARTEIPRDELPE